MILKSYVQSCYVHMIYILYEKKYCLILVDKTWFATNVCTFRYALHLIWPACMSYVRAPIENVVINEYNCTKCINVYLWKYPKRWWKALCSVHASWDILWDIKSIIYSRLKNDLRIFLISFFLYFHFIFEKTKILQCHYNHVNSK